MQCLFCQRDLEEGAQFCDTCGQSVAATGATVRLTADTPASLASLIAQLEPWYEHLMQRYPAHPKDWAMYRERLTALLAEVETTADIHPAHAAQIARFTELLDRDPGVET